MKNNDDPITRLVPPKGTKGYDFEKNEWKNRFWAYYWADKERILEYQRSRSDWRRYTNNITKLEWYKLLLENAYEMEFDSLIPYELPVKGFLKRNRWLHEFIERDNKYVYLFDPLYMNEDKEKEFRSELNHLIETRINKNIKYYEDSRNNK